MTDTEILERIHAKEADAIELLYDKYAANIFGIINVISKNTSLNEFILLKVFTNLISDIKPALQCRHLISWLYGYTLKFTLTELRARGIEPDTADIKNSPPLIQKIYNTLLVNYKAGEQFITMSKETNATIPKYN